jgi:hypothetical protein
LSIFSTAILTLGRHTVVIAPMRLHKRPDECLFFSATVMR